MKWLRRLGRGIVALAVAAGLFLMAARYHDGPLGPIAGGPFRSGEWVESRGLDWSFAADLPTLELQLLSPPRSRTVWLLLHEGHLYIPCGFVNVSLWKQWPYEAYLDGRAIVRIAGRRYPVRLVRSDDESVRRAVLAGVAAKYDVALGEGDAKDVWIFRVDPRERRSPGF